MAAAHAPVLHRRITTAAAPIQGGGGKGRAGKKLTKKLKRVAAPEEREVHEVTESSSDESETVSRGYKRKMVWTKEQLEEVTARGAVYQQEEDMLAPEVVEEMRQGVYMPDPEDVSKTKNVADMNYLFTNDKLKEESPAIVLRSDPFCIPRVTDNVPNYRPMLNPLSIFLAEDQLLPCSFRLDPSERPPTANGEVAAAASLMTEDGSQGPRGRLFPLPSNSSSTSSAGRQLRGKTSTFMGTMPRQLEFAEMSVSEALFQNHALFRPPAALMKVPISPTSGKQPPLSMNWKSSNTLFTTSRSECDQLSTSFAGDRAASLSDAMLLSSIQHTLDIATVAPASNGGTSSSSDGVAESMPSLLEEGSTCQIQPLQPLDSVADTLTNYLPSRSLLIPNMSSPVDGPRCNLAEGCKPTDNSIGYVACAFPTLGDLLSPIESQASTPYGGLFVDSSEPQLTSEMTQTCSGLISITTPKNGASGINTGLITPQRRSSEGSLRRSGAKRPRAKNVFRPCTFPGCTKGARGKAGRCQKHGGGKRCAIPECPKGAQGSSTMCLFHGGGYRCTVEGCSTGARGTSGLCARHGGYKKGKSGVAGEREMITDDTSVKRVRRR
uniref:WRKY transcription factor 19 n=1 Tax=Hyaloperonospora arabidopsidis (strain Emoy2) TaxID=559515 RepID=M4BGI9_HYAAE